MKLLNALMSEFRASDEVDLRADESPLSSEDEEMQSAPSTSQSSYDDPKGPPGASYEGPSFSGGAWFDEPPQAHSTFNQTQDGFHTPRVGGTRSRARISQAMQSLLHLKWSLERYFRHVDHCRKQDITPQYLDLKSKFAKTDWVCFYDMK